jgi:hypothetical protein
MTDDKKVSRNAEAFAVVGELVMISSAIDHLLNNVLIAVLDLGTASLLEPVVATLDPARKVEILKERAAHITATDWKKGITKFCDKVESVFRQRNIACHTPPVLEAGIWTFKPVAAAKLLKKLDLAAKKVKPVHLADFEAAIKIGEDALGAGVQLIENFKRYNAEISRRSEAKRKER